MRVVVAAALIAGCGSSSHGSGSLVEVYAFAGASNAAEGATVIAQKPTGEPLDTTLTDATGHAEMSIVDGSLITVVFPPMPSSIDPAVWLVTAPAPAAGGELDIHGPIDTSSPPTVAGVLTVDVKHMLQGATAYAVELGCTTTMATALPTSVDVSSRCLGSDTNIDVLVLGTGGGQVLGYTAARLDLSNGAAMLAPTDWTTTNPTVPITLTGVTPLLDWVLYSDGLPFAAQPISGSAPLWTGLTVDSAVVHATIAQPSTQQIATQYVAGAPASIAFGASDFLPPISQSLVLDTSNGTQLSWAQADTGADAIDLHLEWDVGLRGPAVPPGAHHVTWDVVLPPDATSVALAKLSADLGTLVGPPDATPDAILRYVATTPATGWDTLFANGLWLDAASGVSTVAPPIGNGELRETRALGYAP